MMRIAMLSLAMVLGTAAVAAPDPASGPSPDSDKHYPVDTLKCKDGSTALYPIRQGTCSGHGGVAASAPLPVDTLKCNDGSTALYPIKQGTCSGHGGVATSAPLPVDTVKCKDGTTGLLPIKKGTCSGHGGVEKQPNDPPAAVTPTPVASPAAAAPPKGATAQCKDGTFSMSKTHSGACSGHGGVDRWL